MDLEIALREALANAIIHGNDLEDGKRIFLRCYGAPGSDLLILVRDEGPGVRRSDQERIFHRFEQVHDHDDPDIPPGSGLGLAVAKEIVEAHGGRVAVRSRSGHGSGDDRHAALRRGDLPGLPRGLPRRSVRV